MKRHLLARYSLLRFLLSAPASESTAEAQAIRTWKLAAGPAFARWPADACAFLGRDLRAVQGRTCRCSDEFMKEHRGVDVVTISADLVPDLPDATRSMLERAGLQAADNWIFERWLCRTASIRNRSCLAGRHSPHDPDLARRDDHDDRGGGRNSRTGKMVRSTSLCDTMIDCDSEHHHLGGKGSLWR